jgi:two-component system sensor histidine kinase VanS
LNNHRSRKLRRSIARSLFVRVLIETGLIYLAMIVIYFLAIMLAGIKTWHETELLWQIYQAVRANPTFPIAFCACLGFIAALLHSWFVTLGYLEELIEAAKNINDKSDDLIGLPPRLKEAELEMNNLKLHVRENERIAKDAEQRKNDLVVYLAHDLKTPLTSVIGYLSLLTEEQQISEQLREKYLSISLKKAERLEDLINEFFEITRFNLSTLTLEPGTVNLTRMLEQIIFEFAPMLAEKKLACTLDAAPDIIMKLDAGKMQRVFDNLLRNAVTYSYDGSEIKITIRLEDDHMEDKKIHICFQNNGDTIPQEKLSRIFEQFYRLDSARSSQSGNAGLGLAIAKEIVELHSGTIAAASAEDTIIFDVNLPILHQISSPTLSCISSCILIKYIYGKRNSYS